MFVSYHFVQKHSVFLSFFVPIYLFILKTTYCAGYTPAKNDFLFEKVIVQTTVYTYDNIKPYASIFSEMPSFHVLGKQILDK